MFRWPKSWAVFCGWALMGLFLAGCHAGQGSDSRFADLPGVTQGSAAEPTPTGAGTPAVVPVVASLGAQPAGSAPANAEVLKVGDTLNIVYSDTPLVLQPFDGPIKEDGSITLIYSKSFQAAGKTPGQLEKEIHEAYVPNIFKYMTVTVTHKDLTRFYFVGGEVKQPGREPWTGPITLLRAIQTAGDFTDFAKKTKVLVARGNNKTITVNCVKARTHPELDIDIYPGDKITVLRRII